MPNHVYNVISVEGKYADRLKKIAEVGLCRYYKPMPKELEGFSSPVSIVSEEEYQKALASDDGIMGLPMTAQMQSDFIRKYGDDNWYKWCNRNWGTKWGVYDGECDGGRYSFTTAWSTVSSSIIQMLLNDIPDLVHWWEEEQGFGEEVEFKKGRAIRQKHCEEKEEPNYFNN